MTITEILDVEQLEVNIYRGGTFGAESDSFQRTFGGQVAGQSLVSAERTVEAHYQVHSLHGYFLRPGDPHAPIVFLVERLRDGDSFCTRRVSAVQHGETIFYMSASFHSGQAGIEHQDAMPTVAGPEELPEIFGMDVFDDEAFKVFREWDLRRVPHETDKSTLGAHAIQRVWLRHRTALPDDPVLHVCALAYISDLTLLSTAWSTHSSVRDHLQVASLDHAMWFMRPFRADEWLLYDQSSPSACGGRAIAQGKIYRQDGTMVAAVMQEGLTRYRRGFTAATA
jgi:acyl-CoA thioesterase-2